jgi:hypothetical protein
LEPRKRPRHSKPPEIWADSDDLTKHPGEMGLVSHSTLECDLRKRGASVAHDGPGVADSPPRDIGEGSLTETLCECASGYVTVGFVFARVPAS